MAWHYALASNELTPNQMKRIVIEKQPILLINHAGKIYALDDRCPHMKAPLFEGHKEGSYVVCKKHGAKINFTNGEIAKKAQLLFLKMPTKKASTLTTKEEDHKIFVQI